MKLDSRIDLHKRCRFRTCKGVLIDLPVAYKVWAYWCPRNPRGWTAKPCVHKMRKYMREGGDRNVLASN